MVDRRGRPSDRDPGRRPTEPGGRATGVHTFRRVWFAGWLAAGLAALAIFAVLWASDAGTATLGLVGTAAGLAITIALHHLVVTGDLGERTIPRPGPVDELAAFRGRRRLVGGVLGGAALAGIGGLSALLRYGRLEPLASDWAAGAALTTLDGERVRPEDLALGSVVTVWPPHAIGEELSAVMLIRLRVLPEPPTLMRGVVGDSIVAYSRLCTHAGCAVALYRARDQALFCPCHQATFDARRGAVPVSGPASRPLPQLPLDLDTAGFLVATGGLTAPPGAVGGTV